MKKVTLEEAEKMLAEKEKQIFDEITSMAIHYKLKGLTEPQAYAKALIKQIAAIHLAIQLRDAKDE